MTGSIQPGCAVGAAWLAAALIVGGGGAWAETPSGPPRAPAEPVVDDYFGAKVTDNYRWMEDRTAPRFVAWAKAEDAYARAVIGRIPGRDALQQRIAAHTGGGVAVSGLRVAGGLIFYGKRAPDQNTFKLYVRDTLNHERLLVDPDARATAAAHMSIDYYQPSPDGSKLVYALSAGGSENSVIHVMDVASGQDLPESIDRTEYGSPSWLPDGSGFYYNRFALVAPGAPETERYLNSRAYLHLLGSDPTADKALIGAGLPGSPPVTPVDVPTILTSASSHYAIAWISHGADPAGTAYIAPLDQANRPDAPWRKVADVADAVVDAELAGDHLYLLSHKHSPNYEVLELKADAPDMAQARVAAPAGSRVIEAISPARDALYLQDLEGGISKLRRLDYDTGAVTEVALPAEGSLTGPYTDPLLPGALFSLQGWVQAPRAYAYVDGRTSALDVIPAWREDLSAYVAEETTATAPDGVQIPLSIIHRRGLAPTRSTPLWITAYGAYGIALNPTLHTDLLTLLDDGGVFAVCHVRGGGEFGEAWHLAGKMATKPNTYRDLIACTEHLHQTGAGSPATTAIEGGSAGGITVGMALTERPDLFRVVFSKVGDSNTLRSEQGTDGPANSLEYGSVATEAGFKALYAVDSVQHVRDHTSYPAVLLTTGMNDPRVAPWQPGKMAARLQAATSSGRPVLLLVDFDAGHGIGSTKAQRDRQTADQLAFFYWQIGLPTYQPAR